jgi:hypothetical protein
MDIGESHLKVSYVLPMPASGRGGGRGVSCPARLATSKVGSSTPHMNIPMQDELRSASAPSLVVAATKNCTNGSPCVPYIVPPGRLASGHPMTSYVDCTTPAKFRVHPLAGSGVSQRALAAAATIGGPASSNTTAEYSIFISYTYDAPNYLVRRAQYSRQHELA